MRYFQQHIFSSQLSSTFRSYFLLYVSQFCYNSLEVHTSTMLFLVDYFLVHRFTQSTVRCYGCGCLRCCSDWRCALDWVREAICKSSLSNLIGLFSRTGPRGAAPVRHETMRRVTANDTLELLYG